MSDRIFNKDQVEQLRLSILTPLSQETGQAITREPTTNPFIGASRFSFQDGLRILVRDEPSESQDSYEGVFIQVGYLGEVDGPHEVFTDKETAIEWIREAAEQERKRKHGQA